MHNNQTNSAITPATLDCESVVKLRQLFGGGRNSLISEGINNLSEVVCSTLRFLDSRCLKNDEQTLLLSNITLLSYVKGYMEDTRDVIVELLKPNRQ